MALAEHLRDKPAQRYGLALFVLAAAIVARVVLDAFIPDRLLFITFFPAVIVCAFFCGLGPAIMVLILSALAGALWSEGDPARFRIVALILFLSIGGLIVVLAQSFVIALGRVRRQDEQLTLINQELKHRIKNLFSIADALCQQTIKSGSSIDEMSKAVSGRLQAIAAAQDLLSVTATEGADLAELVAALAGTLAPTPSRLRTYGERILLPSAATTPFALVLHELATNALKYGAWSVDSGHVDVQWSLVNGELVFSWREHGDFAIAPPLREGFGSKLIKDGLAGATVRHEVRRDGLDCEIRLPVIGQAQSTSTS